VREPALERRKEREERVGMQTLQLGSLGDDGTMRASDAAVSAPAVASSLALGSTARLSNGGTQPLDVEGEGPSPTAASKTLRGHDDVDKPTSRQVRGDVAHEGLHDDFFDAGDQGTYDVGRDAHEQHVLLDDELEPDVPRVVVRTPEQEQRRARLMQVVGVVVGVVLGVFVFAVLRGRTPEEPKPVQVEPPAQVEPPPPAQLTPPPPPPEPAANPPPVVEALPEAPAEVAIPAEKPRTEPPATPKPAPVREPARATATPRPQPVTPPAPVRPPPAPAAQPKGPPPPAGKPPTVSFPD
jgi:hypothetical protein